MPLWDLGHLGSTRQERPRISVYLATCLSDGRGWKMCLAVCIIIN